MSAKKVFFAALMGMCWSWCQVQAQDFNQPGSMPAPVPQNIATPVQGGQPADHAGTGLSSWITYDRGNCCAGSGGGMPILTEFVLRVGPSFPVGGEYFGRNLAPGWMIEGGVRAMFFNHEWSRAWAVELSVSNTYNESHTSDTFFLAHTFNQLVTVRALNRTYANLALGREWYLGAPANSGVDWTDWRIRFGADVGGRYGSEDVKFIETRHHTDVTEGVYVALHSDLELPMGRWTLLAGLRTEYGYSFSNVFAVNKGSVQDMTFLFNFGARY